MKTPKEIFAAMEGKWTGETRTWFEPDKLADESKIEGEFSRVLNGVFLRHSYTGSMQGKPRVGEETLMHNPAKGKFEVAWIDSFHMSAGILFSEGDADENGFSVTGAYDVAPGQPKWGWRTVYEVTSADTFLITAYNILPEGLEAKAVEINYTRVKAV